MGASGGAYKMALDLAPNDWQVIDGQWLHRPRAKVVINAVLRLLQPWPRKLVIYSRCEGSVDGRPRCVGYGCGLVLHRRAG